MFNLSFPWKSFNIQLADLHSFLSNKEFYCGISANSELVLHFTEEPSQATKDLIITHLDSLNETEENIKIQLRNDRNDIIAIAKNAMLTSDMTTWIPAERKLFMNLELTDADKDALILKHLGGN